MATIRKRNGKWQAQVRIKGSPPLSRSFASKCDAQRWANAEELKAQTVGIPTNIRQLDRITVGELLRRYEAEIVAGKKGKVREEYAIRALQRHPIAQTPLSNVTEGTAAAYRDARLKVVKPGTVNRELAVFQHAFETARRVWNLPIHTNPFAAVQKPRANNARSRRLEPGEWAILYKCCCQSRNTCLTDMVELAVETAMRRSEVLRIATSHYDRLRRTLLIPQSKNGYSRTIPLTRRAEEIVIRRIHTADKDTIQLFNTTEDAIKTTWRYVKRRAGLEDFHYHDLRHEAISRFFEIGLTIVEVALISGHRDFKMLARYTHIRPETVAMKLANNRSWSEPPATQID